MPIRRAFAEPRWCCAGQTAITDATIWAAVEECQAESATFDCPASQATYGPIEDWDVGAVTSLNNHGVGCTEDAEYKCGRANRYDQIGPLRFDVAPRLMSRFVCSVLPMLGLQ